MTPARCSAPSTHYGRYAYANQAPIAQWNLARLAETLLAFLHENREEAIRIATERIEAFPAIYTRHWLAGFRRKIGLVAEEDGDLDLIQALLDAMQLARADFTITFRALSNGEEPEALADWLPQWRERLARDPQTAEERRALMRAVNPAYIPRNHRVEEMIQAAVERAGLRALRGDAPCADDPLRGAGGGGELCRGAGRGRDRCTGRSAGREGVTSRHTDRHPGARPGSRFGASEGSWIPAFAGMTVRGVARDRIVP